MMKLPSKPLVGCALVALTVGACATIEELAPPVDDAMLSAAGASQVSAASVERGRDLYVTDCARCHSPEPVTRYSAQQWRTILPRMTKEAALSEADRAAVEAYIMTVLASRDKLGQLPILDTDLDEPRRFPMSQRTVRSEKRR